jgi:hypothetical protein
MEGKASGGGSLAGADKEHGHCSFGHHAPGGWPSQPAVRQALSDEGGKLLRHTCMSVNLHDGHPIFADGFGHLLPSLYAILESFRRKQRSHAIAITSYYKIVKG